LRQAVALPAHARLDYLRWGGTLRTYSSRVASTLRVDLLDAEGRVLLSDSSDPHREAEWTRVEGLTPIPEGAERFALVWETEGTDLGAFADAFFAGIVGGPDGDGWFVRGDVDRDERISITDAVDVLLWLFAIVPGLEVCEDAADANDDGDANVTDAVRILTFLFGGGPAPPAPGPVTPGPDPTPDGLGCR
jgi:hypothetical protein